MKLAKAAQKTREITVDSNEVKAGPKLALEEEKAIRTYLSRIFVPISGAVAAFAFLIGFVISESAEITAISKSQEEEKKALERIDALNRKALDKIDSLSNDAQKRLLDISGKIYESQQEFTEKILLDHSKARATLSKITALTEEAKELDRQVKQLATIENAKTVVDGLTAALKEDKKFQAEIVEGVERQFGQLKEEVKEHEAEVKSKIDEVESRLLTMAKGLVSVGNGSEESGYVDLGGKYRIQWGEFRTVKEAKKPQPPVKFSAPFANNNPVVVASTAHVPTSKYRGRHVNIENINSSSFTPAVVGRGYTTLDVKCMYIAIGNVP